jgi:hypothetical protein
LLRLRLLVLVTIASLSSSTIINHFTPVLLFHMLTLRISAFLAIAFGAISVISLPRRDLQIRVEARNYDLGENLQVRDVQLESRSRYVIFYDYNVSVELM